MYPTAFSEVTLVSLHSHVSQVASDYEHWWCCCQNAAFWLFFSASHANRGEMSLGCHLNVISNGCTTPLIAIQAWRPTVAQPKNGITILPLYQCFSTKQRQRGRKTPDSSKLRTHAWSWALVLWFVHVDENCARWWTLSTLMNIATSPPATCHLRSICISPWNILVETS